MDSISFIILFAVLAILFVFMAIIINVRSRASVISKTKESDFIDKFIGHKKEKLMKIPGAISIKTYIFLMISAPLIIGLSSWFMFSSALLTVAASVISIFIPEILTKISENKQKKDFEERYSRALRQLSSSLRAGMTLQQAVEDLCACPFIHYEIKKEFRKVDADIKVGISVPDAFEAMAERLPTDDVKDVASAIRMQTLVGGSEAESIEMISANISSRLMLRKEIKTLFANVKMTIWGMDLLPVFIIVFLYVTSPSYFEPLFNSVIGKLIFVFSIIMMVIGSVVDRKFINSVRSDV